MDAPRITLRFAEVADLPGINAVVDRAVMTWELPDRVKRLALPVYRYDELDLGVMGVHVAGDPGGAVVGVAAWEPADPSEVPNGRTAMLLHGLYVDPIWQGCGIGSRLFEAAEHAAREQDSDGLLVKAQRDAEPFFLRRGLARLVVDDWERDYQGRFWKPLSSADCDGS